MVARITHERAEREALEQQRLELQKRKQKLIAENKKRRDDLANLDKDLEKFIDVSLGLLSCLAVLFADGLRCRLPNRFRRCSRRWFERPARSPDSVLQMLGLGSRIRVGEPTRACFVGTLDFELRVEDCGAARLQIHSPPQPLLAEGCREKYGGATERMLQARPSQTRYSTGTMASRLDRRIMVSWDEKGVGA